MISSASEMWTRSASWPDFVERVERVEREEHGDMEGTALSITGWVQRVQAGEARDGGAPLGAPGAEGWLAPGLPFSFVYGGRPGAELTGTWRRSTASGPGPDVRSVVLEDPATGLVVTWEATTYADPGGGDLGGHLPQRGPGRHPDPGAGARPGPPRGDRLLRPAGVLRHGGPRHPGRLRAPGALPAQRARRALPPGLARAGAAATASCPTSTWRRTGGARTGCWWGSAGAASGRP